MGRDQMVHVGSKMDIWHSSQTSQRLSEIARDTSRAEFTRLAGLDFSLEKVQLEYQGKPVKDVYGIHVVGEAEPLRGVAVGRVYELVQPSRLLDMSDAVLAADSAAYRDVGGTLFDKRKAWLNIRLGGESRIVRGGKAAAAFDGGTDVSLPNLLLSTTFDASQNTVVARSLIRAVCQNTINMAADSGNACWIRHTKSQDGKLFDAVKALEVAYKELSEGTELFQGLADTPMERNAARGFFAMLLTETETLEEATAKIRKAKESAPRTFSSWEDQGSLLMGLFERGTGNFGQDRYDALNAVTEYIDHQRARIRAYRGKTATQQADHRLDSTQFGSGAATKRRAVRLLSRN